MPSAPPHHRQAGPRAAVMGRGLLNRNVPCKHCRCQQLSGQNVEREGPARKVLTIQEGKEKVINLDVIVGIPVRIINNDCVGCSKVYAQTTGAGREEKAELLSTRS